MICDKCGQRASVYVTQIVFGKKTETHLCEACAKAEGLPASKDDITELLDEFVKRHRPHPRQEPPAHLSNE
jgi:protein-arginine kinase activator protein McsA